MLPERCRAMSLRPEVPTGNGHWRGSASIGVAVRTPDMVRQNELILLADRGVFLAEQAGRNCVRSVTPALGSDGAASNATSTPELVSV
jgi:GGDEF domain-containing protein